MTGRNPEYKTRMRQQRPVPLASQQKSQSPTEKHAKQLDSFKQQLTPSNLNYTISKSMEFPPEIDVFTYIEFDKFAEFIQSNKKIIEINKQIFPTVEDYFEKANSLPPPIIGSENFDGWFQGLQDDFSKAKSEITDYVKEIITKHGQLLAKLNNFNELLKLPTSDVEKIDAYVIEKGNLLDNEMIVEDLKRNAGGSFSPKDERKSPKSLFNRERIKEKLSKVISIIDQQIKNAEKLFEELKAELSSNNLQDFGGASGWNELKQNFINAKIKYDALIQRQSKLKERSAELDKKLAGFIESQAVEQNTREESIVLPTQQISSSPTSLKSSPVITGFSGLTLEEQFFKLGEEKTPKNPTVVLEPVQPKPIEEPKLVVKKLGNEVKQSQPIQVETKLSTEELLNKLESIRKKLSSKNDSIQKLKTGINEIPKSPRYTSVVKLEDEFKNASQYLPRLRVKKLSEELEVCNGELNSTVEELDQCLVTVKTLNEDVLNLYQAVSSDEENLDKIKNAIIQGLKNTLFEYYKNNNKNLAVIEKILSKNDKGLQSHSEYKISLLSVQENDINQIKENKDIQLALEKAKKENKPILIRTKNNNFIIYGKTNDVWGLTPVSDFSLHFYSATNDAERRELAQVMELKLEKSPLIARSRDNKYYTIYSFNGQTWGSKRINESLPTALLDASLKSGSSIASNDPRVASLLPEIEQIYKPMNSPNNLLRWRRVAGVQASDFDLKSNDEPTFSVLMDVISKGHIFSNNQATLSLTNENVLKELSLADLIQYANGILNATTSLGVRDGDWVDLAGLGSYLSFAEAKTLTLSYRQFLRIEPDGQKFLEKKKDVPSIESIKAIEALEKQIEEKTELVDTMISEEEDIEETVRSLMVKKQNLLKVAIEEAKDNEKKLSAIPNVNSEFTSLQHLCENLQKLLDLPNEHSADKNSETINDRATQVRSQLLKFKKSMKDFENFFSKKARGNDPLSNTKVFCSMLDGYTNNRREYIEKIKQTEEQLKQASAMISEIQEAERKSQEEKIKAQTEASRRAAEEEAKIVAELERIDRLAQEKSRAAEEKSRASREEYLRLEAEEKRIEEEKSEERLDKFLNVLKVFLSDENVKNCWAKQVSFAGKYRPVTEGSQVSLKYDFVLKSKLDTIRRPGIIYYSQNANGSLEFELLGVDGKFKYGTIQQNKLPNNFNVSNLSDEVKKNILDQMPNQTSITVPRGICSARRELDKLTDQTTMAEKLKIAQDICISMTKRLNEHSIKGCIGRQKLTDTLYRLFGTYLKSDKTLVPMTDEVLNELLLSNLNKNQDFKILADNSNLGWEKIQEILAPVQHVSLALNGE